MSFDLPFGRLFGFGNFVITLICSLVLLLLAIVLSVLFLLAIVLSVLLLLAIVLSVLLLLAIVLSVIFLLAIVLSVLRLTASDYLWVSSNFSCTRLASRITFTVYIQEIGKPNKFIV